MRAHRPLFTLLSLAIGGCAAHPSTARVPASTYNYAFTDLRTREVEGRKDELLRQLAICESGGEGDSLKPIYGGRGTYIGRFQFTVRTVITYVQQMDGRLLSSQEAVSLAHDYSRAAELAKFVIFEKDGIGNWPLCNRRLGLAQQVAEIKSL